MQADAVHLLDPLGHLDHEGEDVVGRAAGVGLDEVGVLVGDGRAPPPVALEAGGIDEPAGGVAERVGEHGAGVGPARLVARGASARWR